MNSGLQCLSNSPELTKFFLLGNYKSQINKENPLGMGGKLAKAYAGLISEMWIGTDNRTAPHELKRTLGSKISRFSGYG
jgi:ubiquitin C-terminal hydrolase